MPNDFKETPSQSIKPEAVQRHDTVISSGQEYLAAKKEWDKEAEVLKRQNIDPGNPPSAPENFSVYTTLVTDQMSYSELANASMATISQGTHPEMYSLGYPVPPAEESQEKIKKGRQEIGTLIGQLAAADVEDLDIRELVTMSRAIGLIKGLDSYGGLSESKLFIADIVESYPDCLHLIPSYCHDFVSGFDSSLIFNGPSVFQDPNTLRILTVLSKDSSPLSDYDRQRANFYVNEFIGFQIYNTLGNQENTPLNPSFLSRLSKGVITEEQSISILQGNIILTIDDLPRVLAEYSKNPELSPAEKRKYQAIAVGAIRGLVVFAYKNVENLPSPNQKKLNQKGIDKINKVGPLIVSLIDDGTNIYSVLRNYSGNDPLFTEISRIYNDSKFSITYQPNENVFDQQAQKWHRRQEEMRQEEETKKINEEKRKEADRLQREKSERQQVLTFITQSKDMTDLLDFYVSNGPNIPAQASEKLNSFLADLPENLNNDTYKQMIRDYVSTFVRTFQDRPGYSVYKTRSEKTEEKTGSIFNRKTITHTFMITEVDTEFVQSELENLPESSLDVDLSIDAKRRALKKILTIKPLKKEI